MEKSSKDPSDGAGGGIIVKETDCACCEDGACSWHENTPAQSEGDKGGAKKPRPI